MLGKTLGEREREKELPYRKKTLSLIKSTFCEKGTKKLLHTSPTTLLSFRGPHMANMANKVEIGTQGGQKLIKKSSGSLCKMVIKRKGKWGEAREKQLS